MLFIYLFGEIGHQKTSGRVQTINLKGVPSNHDDGVQAANGLSPAALAFGSAVKAVVASNDVVRMDDLGVLLRDVLSEYDTAMCVFQLALQQRMA